MKRPPQEVKMAHSTLAQQELVKHDVPALQQWLRTYGVQTCVALALLSFSVLGWAMWRHHRAGLAASASELFAVTREPEQLQQIVQRYHQTPTGPLALLALAASQYRMGDIKTAHANYDRFTTDYPAHSLYPMAILGKAYCMEAAGEWNEAQQAYSAFQAAHPAHYLTPLALFGWARALEALGHSNAARILYEDFLAAESKSPWAPSARAALATLDRLERAARVPLPPPAPDQE